MGDAPTLGLSSTLLRRALDVHDLDAQLVRRAKRQAMRSPAYDGQFEASSRAVVDSCRWHDQRTGTKLIFTRDADAHVSGWWKNPDYARNLHLSLSYWLAPHFRFGIPHNHALSELWCQAFFGDDVRLLWCEPPFSEKGKMRQVWHFRLFCDAHWQPIKPRGEVYTKRFTPAGWLSWSDVQALREVQGLPPTGPVAPEW